MAFRLHDDRGDILNLTLTVDTLLDELVGRADHGRGLERGHARGRVVGRRLRQGGEGETSGKKRHKIWIRYIILISGNAINKLCLDRRIHKYLVVETVCLFRTN